MNYLIIDACCRNNSRTKRLYEEYIKTLKGNIKILKLYDLDLKPLNNELLNKRDNLINNNDFNDSMFSLAKEFIEYDEIIIAAPYWDLSFPSILKIYFENICVNNLTFKYEDNKLIGLAKAKRLIYISTCGGYIDKHLGYEYVAAISKMLGINNTYNFYIEGLDIDPSKEEEIMNIGINKIKSF